MIDRIKRRLRRSIFYLRDRKLIRDHFAREAEPRLQIGTGSTPLPGWLNSDVVASRVSIAMDAARPFPFPDDTFQYVFAEHMVTALTPQQAQGFARECFRVLRPGGVLRISTADLDFFACAVIEPTPESQRYMEWARQTFWPELASAHAAAILSMHLRSWGNQVAYNFMSLENLLTRAGFDEVLRCKVGESEVPALKDLERHGSVVPEEFNRMESLVVEAHKPRKP